MLPGNKNKSAESKRTDNGKEIFRFFRALLQALNWETHTRVGQINLACDFLLVALLALYILSSTATAIARIFASVFNHDLTSNTGENIIGLLLVVLGWFLLCLVVVYITRKELDNRNKETETPPKR